MDMKTYRFGVLGAGSMGKTIAAGAVRAGLFRPDEVLLFNRSEEKRAANRAEGYAVILTPIEPFYIVSIGTNKVFTIEIANKILSSTTAKPATGVDIHNHHPFLVLLIAIDRQLEEVGTLILTRLLTHTFAEGTDIIPLLEIL